MNIQHLLRMNCPAGVEARPHLSHNHLCEIDFHSLGSRGHYVIIDVDNTLALKRSVQVTEEITTFLSKLRQEQTIRGICLVSNVVLPNGRRKRRVQEIAELLGASWYCAYFPHCKPHPKPYQEGMRLLGSTPENTLMIGDQLLTDIRGANRLGLYTIWVQPLGKDGLHSRYKRVIEKWLVKRW